MACRRVGNRSGLWILQKTHSRRSRAGARCCFDLSSLDTVGFASMSLGLGIVTRNALEGLDVRDMRAVRLFRKVCSFPRAVSVDSPVSLGFSCGCSAPAWTVAVVSTDRWGGLVRMLTVSTSLGLVIDPMVNLSSFWGRGA